MDAYGESEQTAGFFTLLVELFEKASLAREYYESFGVNSQNYTQKSAGTSAWIAEYLRLLDRLCDQRVVEKDRPENYAFRIFAAWQRPFEILFTPGVGKCRCHYLFWDALKRNIG